MGRQEVIPHPGGFVQRPCANPDRQSQVFAANSSQIRSFFEASNTPGPAKNVEAKFKPDKLSR
jgi:hypothetical protein